MCLWKKGEVQDNETEHYLYFVIYADNILCGHEYPTVKWRNLDQDNVLRMEMLKSLKDALG